VRKSLKGSPFSADTQHNINKIADDLVAWNKSNSPFFGRSFNLL
jgi:hypothetical protein